MINVLFAQGNCGSWDQGLLLHAISGRLWPLPCDFLPTMGLIPPTPGGAIVVFAGRHLATEDGIRYMKAGLAKLPWALCLHLGDEELVFPSEQLRYPARRLWLQTPNPFIPIRGDRIAPLGPPEDCRAWLRQQPRLAASGRKLWSFAGQINNVPRERLLDALQARPEGEGLLHPSPGFGRGLGRAEYYATLAQSCLVFCPSGNFSPETFRVYEALEAGCIPVAAGAAPTGGWPPDFDYWGWRYGTDNRAFDTWRGSWDETLQVYLGALALAGGPAALQDIMTRCLAFWIGEKRRFALDLVDDCRDLGADVPVPPVTVLVPTAPCPAHPSTDMIADTIRRIRSYPELAHAEVIIMADGVRPDLEHRRNDYQEYLRVLVDRCNWDPDWFGCLPLIFPEWTHQAGMARKALELVRTPFVFYVEHDTHPLGGIPFQLFESALAVLPDVNVIRLHIFESVLPEHEHLYANHGFEFGGARFIETRQWSQRPHLARADWYRQMLAAYFAAGERSFIEDTLASPAESGKIPGVYVYAPEGSMLRSGTCDGRQSDPKAPHGVGR